MGVKFSFLLQGKNVNWVCLRERCWEQLDLREGKQ